MKPLLVLVALLLQAPAATHTVSGRVTMFPNATTAPSTLILRSFALREGPGQGKTTTVRPDGTFEFAGVLPPECDLNFYDDKKPFQRLVSSSISAPYTVDTPIGPGLNFTFGSRDASGIEIKAPAPLSGRVVMAGGDRLPPAIAISTTTPLSYNDSFRSSRLMNASTASEPGGLFTLDVFPGTNKIGVNLPAGYVLKSITYDSLDVTANPLTLSSLPTSMLVITLDVDTAR